MRIRPTITRLAVVVLLAATLGAHPLAATTYISVEPIPNRDVVGADDLATIQRAGYANLEQWSNRLLNDCGIVDNVIAVLQENGAISTVKSDNITFRVAAGGFEAVTNPSFVATVIDSEPDGVTEEDVNVLSNALGYVLNQGGTAHFSPDREKAYFFSLDYAVVTFDHMLTGLQAKGFFDFVGTIDFALWGGQFAGFTQIDFGGSPTNNSMLFLKPAATKRRFIDGLFEAASTTTGATYVPLNNNGEPTTAKAGIAFPGNDWVAFPDGDQYLTNLNEPSAELLEALAALRQQHRLIAGDLVNAIERGKLSQYLNHPQFNCRTP